MEAHPINLLVRNLNNSWEAVTVAFAQAFISHLFPG